jgi:hypothetical protein
MDIMVAGARFQEIASRVRYKAGWRTVLRLDENRWYFQWEWDAMDNAGDNPDYVARTRKYYLSPHMTTTEVVNVMFMAALKGEEHETREIFQYRPSEDTDWKSPYNTHIDVESLWEIADCRDEREDDS